MTNKEHLATLSSDEWVQRVDWLYHIYGKGYTQSLFAIKEWLDKEYKAVKPVQTNLPYDSRTFCPVCYLLRVDGDKKCRRCMTDFELSKLDE